VTAGLHRRARGGFTLVEALIATALLGFSLIVMFGFHSQAVRSNREARKMTACTYLAQLEVERLLSLPWDLTNQHTDLIPSGVSDTTTSSNPFPPLFYPASGADPTPVNAANQTTTTLGEPIFYVSWDSEYIDTTNKITLVKVRCSYQDRTFNTWKGTTISTYRWQDLPQGSGYSG